MVRYGMRRLVAKPGPALVAIALVSALAAGSLASCGDDEPAPPTTGFAAALASIGGGGENASLGLGWVDERAAAGLDPAVRAELERALGPNATSVVEAAPRLRRRFGVDPR